MNGDGLIVRVRRLLRDEQSPSSQGEFWDDKQIVLALNASQDLFANYCLNNKSINYLQGLSTQTYFGPSGAVPSDYLHYISATVGDVDSNLELSRIYTGGECIPYLYNKKITATFILGNQLLYYHKGQQTSGNLHYYKYPSYIGATSLGDQSRTDFAVIDFPPFIYYDVITNQAVQLLGMKEIQTQRDFKKRKRLKLQEMLQPSNHDNYLINREHPNIEPVTAKQG